MIFHWLMLLLIASCSAAAQYSNHSQQIITRAAADGIDIPALPFAAVALTAIDDIKNTPFNQTLDFGKATKIDTHVHAAPAWYTALIPPGGAQPMQPWSIPIHLAFNAEHGIALSIISISTPASTIYAGNQTLSVGLARLLNEWLAELSRVFPDRFSFYAVTPLPYVDAALTEVRYAVNELGAKGIGLLTNHEGLYMGDPALRPFFAGLEAMDLDSKVVFIHPTNAECNPNPRIPCGQFEFYFETARNLADMATSRVLQTFTSIKYIDAHMGGAFPSIVDRAFDTGNNTAYNELRQIMDTRIWYESAGQTFPHQFQGLLAYDVPKT